MFQMCMFSYYRKGCKVKSSLYLVLSDVCLLTLWSDWIEEEEQVKQKSYTVDGKQIPLMEPFEGTNKEQ